MAKKTVLKALLKYGPKSVELASEIVEAMNSDGNTIIARKVEQDGKSTVEFDVKYPEIEAPNEENKAPRQKAPVAEKAGKDEKAAEERTPDPVPAKASAPQAQNRRGAAPLFERDEEADFEEQYQREQAGPDFGD
jgi:recombinational DNA repair protein RecT